ncbi:MAG: hypothetical protein NW226_07540 [Microscillaceae bacterium]|nr:hypothetical protein [Microscillaceae bacterium]
MIYYCKYLILGGVLGIQMGAMPMREYTLGGDTKKTLLYIYKGTINQASIRAELEYDIELACPVIKGRLFYDSLPEEPFKVKGGCSYLFCNGRDEEEKEDKQDKQEKYGDMIHLLLLRSNKVQAQVQLCPSNESEYMKSLQGWLYSSQRSYYVTLQLQQVIEE